MTTAEPISPPESSRDYLSEFRKRVDVHRANPTPVDAQRKITAQDAKSILGGNFIDVEECERAHRIKIPKEKMQKLRFVMTEKEAQIVKKMGHRIMLLVDHTRTGRSFTVLSAWKAARTYGQEINLGCPPERIQYEQYATEPQKLAWAQVGAYPEPPKSERDIINQIEQNALRAALSRENFDGIFEALDEFDQQKDELGRRILEGRGVRSLPSDIQKLRIVQMTMPSPVIALQIAMTLRAIGEPLPRMQTFWTNHQANAKGCMLGIRDGNHGEIELRVPGIIQNYGEDAPGRILYRNLSK